MINPIVSLVEKLGKISGDIYLNDVLDKIANGYVQTKVAKIQSLKKEGKSEEAGKLKLTLPAFIPTGKFIGGHKVENLSIFSSVVILDYDNINSNEYDLIFAKACSIKTTLACFRSPSGNGLKILVPISSGQAYFTSSFLEVADYYEGKLGIPTDCTGKNISRLCFFSYDPKLFRNLNCDIFQNTPAIEISEFEMKIDQMTDPELIDTTNELWFILMERKTERLVQYIEGNRNNFIMLLSCNCARLGLSIEDVKKWILKKYKYDAIEIVKTINSAYKTIQTSRDSDRQKSHLFSINLLNLRKYKPEVEVDKRILFEALLIKMLSFNGSFYFSKMMISRELGIRRTRSTRIINEFLKMGFISAVVKNSQIEGNPRQITHFRVIPEKVIESSKLLLLDNKDFVSRIAPFLTVPFKIYKVNGVEIKV